MVWVATCSWATSHLPISHHRPISRIAEQDIIYDTFETQRLAGLVQALVNAGRVEVMGCVEEGRDQRVGWSCFSRSDESSGLNRRGSPLFARIG